MATPSAQFSLTLRVEISAEDLRRVEDYIIPSVFNREVSREVARAVSEEARRTGALREPTTDTAELSIP